MVALAQTQAQGYPRAAELIGALTATVSMLPAEQREVGESLLKEVNELATWKCAHA